MERGELDDRAGLALEEHLSVRSFIDVALSLGRRAYLDASTEEKYRKARMAGKRNRIAASDRDGNAAARARREIVLNGGP